MPKMTAKYSGARQTALHENISLNGDQEALYKRLNESGIWWDSKAGQWVKFSSVPADEPTPKIMVRIWAAEGQIKEAVDNVVRGLRGKCKLINRSDPYPCRPPKQKEIRVYLEFLPGDDSKSSFDEIVRDNDPFAVEVE